MQLRTHILQKSWKTGVSAAWTKSLDSDSRGRLPKCSIFLVFCCCFLFGCFFYAHQKCLWVTNWPASGTSHAVTTCLSKEFCWNLPLTYFIKLLSVLHGGILLISSGVFWTKNCQSYLWTYHWFTQKRPRFLKLEQSASPPLQLLSYIW